MLTELHEQQRNQGVLLDWAIEKLGLKNDAALAAKLGVCASVVCKMRKERMPIGPSILLKLHDLTDTPARELRKLMSVEQPGK